MSTADSSNRALSQGKLPLTTQKAAGSQVVTHVPWTVFGVLDQDQLMPVVRQLDVSLNLASTLTHSNTVIHNGFELPRTTKVQAALGVKDPDPFEMA